MTLTSPSGTSAVLASHPATGTGSGIAFEASANTFWGDAGHDALKRLVLTQGLLQKSLKAFLPQEPCDYFIHA